MKFKTFLSTLLLAGLAASSQAQIAGHNVILIHGFQPDNIVNKPQNDNEIVQNGQDYWSDYWNVRAEARFDWDSSKRIEGATAHRLYNDAVKLSLSGLCDDGCVLVTHSTGDLVARYLIENQADWLAAAGYKPLNILASLDFAGAGGGTEIANVAVSIATSKSRIGSLMVSAVEFFMGGKLESVKDLGVLYDLQPSAARNLATSNSRVPRLRFAGAGSQFFGATGLFISGTDDGVVPTHSSCGAVDAKAYDSCSRGVEFNGTVKDGRRKAKAPSNLFANHFPVLMGKKTHHGGTIGTQKGVKLTYVNNNFNRGIKVNFATEQYRKWFKNYRYVRNSKNASMSANVYQALNR